MKIEIQGQDALKATEELLAIERLEGSYQTIEEVEREGTLATIATIVGIVRWNIDHCREHSQVEGEVSKLLI